MHRLTLQNFGRCVIAWFAGAVVLVPAWAVADDAPAAPAFKEPVVPPGQEALLSAMLGRGAALPDGCKFAGGDADGPIIHATYQCPTGDVVVQVVHSTNAPATATQTERFAVSVESGSPPSDLTDALASLIHAREAEFEWLWLTPEEDAADDGDAG